MKKLTDEELNPSSIKTIEQLNGVMLKTLDELRADPKTLAVAKGVANLAGKAMATVKLQLATHAMLGEAPNIPFMTPSRPATKINAQKGRKVK